LRAYWHNKPRTLSGKSSLMTSTTLEKFSPTPTKKLDRFRNESKPNFA
jgi:hypothetical protein